MIQKEYGTLVEKEKKKKKKKNKEKEKQKKIWIKMKIKENALNSEIYNVNELTQKKKEKYSIAENHPLKIICTNLPFKIAIEELFQYFNTVIATSNPELATPPPVKTVEFDKTEHAILTMSSRRVKDFFRSHPEFHYTNRRNHHLQNGQAQRLLPRKIFEKK